MVTNFTECRLFVVILSNGAKKWLNLHGALVFETFTSLSFLDAIRSDQINKLYYKFIVFLKWRSYKL